MLLPIFLRKAQLFLKDEFQFLLCFAKIKNIEIIFFGKDKYQKFIKIFIKIYKRLSRFVVKNFNDKK